MSRHKKIDKARAAAAEALGFAILSVEQGRKHIRYTLEWNGATFKVFCSGTPKNTDYAVANFAADLKRMQRTWRR